MKINKHFCRNDGFKQGDITEYFGKKRITTGMPSIFKNQNNIILKKYTKRTNMMIEGQYTEQEVLNLAKRAYTEGSASFAISRAACALLVITTMNRSATEMAVGMGEPTLAAEN